MGVRSVRRWVKHFKDGNRDIAHLRSSGWTRTATTECNEQKAHALNTEDRMVSVRERVVQLGTEQNVVEMIKTFGYRKVSCWWVPRLLPAEHKRARNDVSQMLQRHTILKPNRTTAHGRASWCNSTERHTKPHPRLKHYGNNFLGCRGLTFCPGRKLSTQFSKFRRSRNWDVHFAKSARWKDASSFNTICPHTHRTPDLGERRKSGWEVLPHPPYTREMDPTYYHHLSDGSALLGGSPAKRAHIVARYGNWLLRARAALIERLGSFWGLRGIMTGHLQ
jgi:hypothetical protein